MTDSHFGLPAVAMGPGSMPLLGFGTWPISDADVTAAVHVALEAGYRHIDTATGYGNEAGIGRALATSGRPPSAVFLTTKLPPGTRRPGAADAGGEPDQAGCGPRGPVAGALAAGRPGEPAVWERVRPSPAGRSGNPIGVSNYSLEQIDELTEATGVRLP